MTDLLLLFHRHPLLRASRLMARFAVAGVLDATWELHVLPDGHVVAICGKHQRVFRMGSKLAQRVESFLALATAHNPKIEWLGKRVKQPLFV